jgi:hypothetical protein
MQSITAQLQVDESRQHPHSQEGPVSHLCLYSFNCTQDYLICRASQEGPAQHVAAVTTETVVRASRAPIGLMQDI